MPSQACSILDISGRPMQMPPAMADAGALVGRSGNAYSGASVHSRTIGSWGAQLRPVNSEILRDGPKIRARARDLARNHPNGAQAARTIVQGVCGHKLKLALTPDYKLLGISYDEAANFARITESLWEGYAHGTRCLIDAGRRLNFTGLMRSIVRSRFVDGEALPVLEWDKNRLWSTCVRIVDVDRLSNPNGAPEHVQFRGGIELDDYNAPVKYHIRHRHPGEDVTFDGASDMSWRGVNRETDWGRPIVLHFFDHDRPEQIRGMSAFAPVVLPMKMGLEYAEAELANARVQAQVAMTLSTDMNYEDAQKVLGAGMARGNNGASMVDAAWAHHSDMHQYYTENPLMFDGVQVPVLPPNTTLNLESSGHPSSQYADYQRHMAKSNASGLGVDPTSLSQDYSDVSYSAARMSHAQNWRTYVAFRQDLVDHVALPIVHAWAEEALSKGILQMPGKLKTDDFYVLKEYLLKGKFITAGKPMIDPSKERKAQAEGLKINAVTLEEIAAADGKDYVELIEQRAREIRLLEEHGIDAWESNPNLIGAKPYQSPAKENK
jgi:lambda family phage portal protein